MIGEAEKVSDGKRTEEELASEKKFVYNENVSLFSPTDSRGAISPSPHSQVHSEKVGI